MVMPDIQYSNYFLGGIGAVGASIFTNPLEVIKTRLQLQGELTKRGQNVKIYRGVLHALFKMKKYDGFYGLQKGLVPSLSFTFIANAFRLGLFDTISAFGWTRDSQGHSSFLLSLFWGALFGGIGGCVASPFLLVKIQMQSFSHPKIAVGFQQRHEGVIDAFKKIYRARGIGGLYRNPFGMLPRAVLSSGVQMAIFESTKEFLKNRDMTFESATANSFLCALLAGTISTMAKAPFDMIVTRLYNQPLDDAGKGKYYTGFVNCFWKICKTEGYLGLYKGFWPICLRMAPHSTLVLLFYDGAKAIRDKYVIDEAKDIRGKY